MAPARIKRSSEISSCIRRSFIVRLTHDVPERSPLPSQVLDDQDQRFARSLKIPRIFFSLSRYRQEVPPHEPTQRRPSVDAASDSMSFRSRSWPPQDD